MRRASPAPSVPAPAAPRGLGAAGVLVAVLLALGAALGAALVPGGRVAPLGPGCVRAAVAAVDAARTLGPVRLSGGAERSGRGADRHGVPRASGLSTPAAGHLTEVPTHPAVVPPGPRLPVPLLVLALLVLVTARFATGSVPPFRGRGPPAGRSPLPT